MEKLNDAFRVQNYYEKFSHCSMPAVFVPLQENEIQALANGETTGRAASAAVRRIRAAMKHLARHRFVSVDFCSPTDSPRFASAKRGSVVSAESAWLALVSSAKVREQAANGLVSSVCVRSFKVFDIPREFRLFVKNGALAAMSQRFLTRHFKRLPGRTEEYWKIAAKFVESVQADLPEKDIVLDIYITTRKRVVLLDLNPWGAPTDPLMVGSWNRDFSKPLGCLIVPPPQMISGDVNVSF